MEWSSALPCKCESPKSAASRTAAFIHFTPVTMVLFLDIGNCVIISKILEKAREESKRLETTSRKLMFYKSYFQEPQRPLKLRHVQI